MVGTIQKIFHDRDNGNNTHMMLASKVLYLVSDMQNSFLGP
jgi:hypothetical protein